MAGDCGAPEGPSRLNRRSQFFDALTAAALGADVAFKTLHQMLKRSG
jgi:hypothetical protein